ncbi:MAG: hypothetical protein AAGA62_16465, partial [Bacteroidota bacterium]
MQKVLVIFGAMTMAAFVAVVGTLYVVDSSGIPDDFEVHQLDARLLSERRALIVKLPLAYDEQAPQGYPVVYVFGGNTLTFSLAADLELLQRMEHLPPVILVGVPNISQKTRQRDLTPPFLKQDLDEASSPLGRA